MLERSIVNDAPPSYDAAVKDPIVALPAAPGGPIEDVVKEPVASEAEVVKPAAVKLSVVNPEAIVQKKPVSPSSSLQILKSTSPKAVTIAPQGPVHQDMDAKETCVGGGDAVKSCLCDLATVGACAGCTVTIAPALLLCIGACFGKENIVTNTFNCLACLTGCGAATACAATCSTVGLFATPCVAACGEPECLKESAEVIREKLKK